MADFAQRLEKPESNTVFAYSHIVSIETERARIQPRFERTRSRCLQAVGCKLVSADIYLGADDEDNSTNATIVVELPHKQIDAFEHDILEPMSGESADSIKVISRSTQAQNVEQEQGDVEHRVRQLTDYRDRLTALSKRPDVRVDDLIKIESELSNVQSQLEQAAGQQRDVNDRVSKEQLTISLTSGEDAGNPFRPLAQVWHNSIELLLQSVANVLTFLIMFIPWIPVVALGFYLVSWAWRRIRRRTPLSTTSGP